MLFLKEEDVERLFPMRDAVGVMRATFEALAAGEAGNQPRRRLFVPTGAVLHSLGGWWKNYFGTKVYAVHVKHGAHFLVWLCEASTAEPLALIEANHLGRIRTGAASGYATDIMAPAAASSLAVIGSGFQAWTQLEAILTVRPITQVRVFSRSEENRTRFAMEAKIAFGVDVAATSTAEAAVRDADIIVTATWSKDPVLDAAWVKPGAHINAAGSNQAQRRELPAGLVHSARWIAVDSLEQARIEAGDLLLAGDLDKMPLVELQNWPGHERGSRDTTIFKSLGLGVEDVAAAGFVYERYSGADI